MIASLRRALGARLVKAGALVLALAAVPAPLAADEIDLADTPAALALDEHWSAIEPVPGFPSTLPADQLGPAKVIAAFRRPDRRARPSRVSRGDRDARGDRRGDKLGAALVVVRFDGPNQAMWRKSTRRAALEATEAALNASCAAATTGSRCAKLGERKELMLGQLPAAQWRARSRDRTVLVRLLFFRTYTLAALAEVPRGSRELAAARAAVESLAPPPQPAAP